MRVTEKGQVTVPEELLDQLGIEAGSDVEFEIVDDVIVIRKSATASDRDRQFVERLRDRGDVSVTTGEIRALSRGD